MRNSISAMVVVTVISSALVGGTDTASAASVELSTYTCAQFLSDVANQNTVSKLIRSTMMISWAAGYAAAHQKNDIRADMAALKIISGVLGNVCRKSPSELAPRAFSIAIDNFAKRE